MTDPSQYNESRQSILKIAHKLSILRVENTRLAFTYRDTFFMLNTFMNPCISDIIQKSDNFYFESLFLKSVL